MSAPSLRVWCNYPFQEPAARLLRDGTARHQLVHLEPPASGPRQPDAASAVAAEAEILFGQPDPTALLSSPTLRWVQLTSAGFTRYDREDIRQAFGARGAVLTNSSHVFDEPCAEHLAAMMFALARRLPQCVDNQLGAKSWLQHEAHARTARLLTGQTALIYGFGAIARRLAEILAPLRMQLLGVRRAPQGDEGIPILTTEQADARLDKADHVVNILPDSASTRRFFNEGRFARFKHGARFYNIGRGATVDQNALLAALQRAHVESAYLDVTDPEPLPPGHPLWTAPNCWISPHVAGSHSDEEVRLVRHFLSNLEAFASGQPLTDRVF